VAFSRFRNERFGVTLTYPLGADSFAVPGMVPDTMSQCDGGFIDIIVESYTNIP
jgi:hypothetical protein